MRKTEEFLVCELTTEELQQRGAELSATMLSYDDKEQEKKDVTKQLSEELKSLRSRMRQLSKAIRAKQETRSVECEVQMHVPQPAMKRTIRLDTGELLRDEAMTPEERQGNLYEDLGDLRKMWGEGPQPPESDERYPPPEAGA